MVMVAFHHWSTKQLHAGESHIAMCLHIGFCQNIEAIFVAEFVEVWVIGIVRGTYSVYIEPFHCFYIILHLFSGDCPASYLTVIMPVNTMKNYTTTID